MPQRRPVVAPDVPGLAVNRVSFLTTQGDEPSRVRPAILASWRRSKSLNIAPDKIEMNYVRDIDTDTPLMFSAEPVLSHLAERLAGQSVSVVLTDAEGVVLSRRTDDSQLERHLDGVLLAPGFNYAESSVGTNGIGTALEAGSATQVFGHEHYAEHLEALACAGVPIHDPMSGRLLGVVDLTCWRKDAQSLLLTLARSTAEQIQHALLANAGMREFEVLQVYRQTCRRTAGIVFAVTTDATMMNDHARTELDPADQTAVLAYATQSQSTAPDSRRHAVEVVLPSGVPARMYYQSVGQGPRSTGLVVHVKLTEPAGRPTERRSGSQMHLPGLVGDAPLWRRACTQVEACLNEVTWVAVEGEAGVGKLALLRAVQLRQVPARRFAVFDGAQSRTDPNWLGALRAALVDSDAAVITHIDSMDTAGLRALSSALQAATVLRTEGPALWAAVTLREGGERSTALTQLLASFPATVTVPALRMRREDLSCLVPFFLAKLVKQGHVTCSPDAMRLLMRSEWPGNVEQLQRLLRAVVQRRRAGAITAEDLPPEMHSLTRRVLSTLESMERDAIVRSLADADGNKVQAARALGMSRATIYRKIHEYAIVASG